MERKRNPTFVSPRHFAPPLLICDASHRWIRMSDCASLHPTYGLPTLRLLNRPELVQITGTSYLLVSEASPDSFQSTSLGEEIMLPMVLDAVLEPPVQIVEVAQASNITAAKKPIVATVCSVVTSKSGMEYDTNLYMEIYQLLYKIGLRGDSPQTDSLDEDRAVAAAAKILKEPENGSLEFRNDPILPNDPIYRPNPGFIGEDRFTVQTVYKERQFTFNFRMLVYQEGAQDWGFEHDCNEPPFEPYQPDPLVSWYHTTSLQALLSGAKASLTGFADLPGASLGQTTGDKITLDTNAAGHTWFFDYTPYLSEEWLPTSSPTNGKQA
jgi:hypothetical protein